MPHFGCTDQDVFALVKSYFYYFNTPCGSQYAPCFIYVHLLFFFWLHCVFAVLLCFSCCRACSLEPGLSSCSAQSSLLVVHRLSGSIVCAILVPQPGIEPECPALEGGFLTTGPPGKSHFVYFYSVACDSSLRTQTYESDLAYISLLFYPRLSS